MRRMFWLCPECGHKEYVRVVQVPHESPTCPYCFHYELMLLWEEED